jgi:hypothetical protein
MRPGSLAAGERMVTVLVDGPVEAPESFGDLLPGQVGGQVDGCLQAEAGI